MALTIEKLSSEFDRGHGFTGRRLVREAFYKLTFDSSYPTGGESFAPTSALATGDTVFSTLYYLGLDIDAVAKAVADAAIYDRTNSKIVLMVAGAQVANTTDCSTVIVYAHIIGV